MPHLIHLATSKLIRRKLIDLNQKLIARSLSRTQNVFLTPIPPKKNGGCVEHYYHFLFDLVLPLQRILQTTQLTHPIKINSFGPLTQYLSEIFGDLIYITDNTEKHNSRSYALYGMNPRHVKLESADIQDLKNYIFDAYAIRRFSDLKTAIIIERTAPSSFYRNHAKQKGSGAERRSIVNHDALATRLRDSVFGKDRFRNLQLENLTLAEQIEAFRGSNLVIGQHGAGLSNMIWMNPGSNIIELSHTQETHFEVLSTLCQHKHHRFVTEGPHSEIDIDAFEKWVNNLREKDTIL